MNIGRNGGNAKALVENYDKMIHKIGHGDIKGEVSRKDYKKANAHASVTSRNGVINTREEDSYLQGTQYAGKLGNMEESNL